MRWYWRVMVRNGAEPWKWMAEFRYKADAKRYASTLKGTTALVRDEVI